MTATVADDCFYSVLSLITVYWTGDGGDGGDAGGDGNDDNDEGGAVHSFIRFLCRVGCPFVGFS